LHSLITDFHTGIVNIVQAMRIGEQEVASVC